jgi:hypothetical protein
MAASTGPKLLLSTRPSRCTCGFVNPCLGGTNGDLSFPSCESRSCEASSPLSESVSYPSASMSDVGLGTALASPGARNVPGTCCGGLGPTPSEYFEYSLSFVMVVVCVNVEGESNAVGIDESLRLLGCRSIWGNGAGSGVFVYVAVVSESDVLPAPPSCVRLTAITGSFERTTDSRAISSLEPRASAALRSKNRS